MTDTQPTAEKGPFYFIRYPSAEGTSGTKEVELVMARGKVASAAEPAAQLWLLMLTNEKPPDDMQADLLQRKDGKDRLLGSMTSLAGAWAFEPAVDGQPFTVRNTLADTALEYLTAACSGAATIDSAKALSRFLSALSLKTLVDLGRGPEAKKLLEAFEKKGRPSACASCGGAWGISCNHRDPL